MYKSTSSIFLLPIEAILPAYDNLGGNICQIIISTGERITVPKTYRQFMREWFHFLRIDLCAQRMWSQEILGQRNLNPIVISEQVILIPVKIRESFGAKDGCYGYVRSSSVLGIHLGKILLQSGTTITHLSSVETIKTKICHAKLLKYIYKDEFQIQHRIYNNGASSPSSYLNIDEG